MDVQDTIRQLEAEKEMIEQVILQLAQLQKANAGGDVSRKSNRGRKSMGHEERQQVSERMKRYWASRRETKALKTSG